MVPWFNHVMKAMGVGSVLYPLVHQVHRGLSYSYGLSSYSNEDRPRKLWHIESCLVYSRSKKSCFRIILLGVNEGRNSMFHPTQIFTVYLWRVLPVCAREKKASFSLGDFFSNHFQGILQFSTVGIVYECFFQNCNTGLNLFHVNVYRC